MGKVDWTESALNDLRELLAYAEKQSPGYAASLSERLLNAVDKLEIMPQRGWQVAEWSDPAFREVFVPPYRLIYNVRGDDCRIVAVIHAARDMPPAPPVAPPNS